MIFWQALIHSLKLPKKQSVFQLNRVGMDIVVFYLFILLGIVSLPTLIEFLLVDTGLTARMNVVFRLIYYFIFSYLPLTIIVFLLLSLVAYIGLGLTRLLKRKLHYAILWKMSAFISTIPFLLYTIVSLFYPLDDHWLFVLIPYTLIFLFKIITIYPKRPT
ncbi:MAG TPA: DUF1189 family protein [Cerasibacillus sp.]|uniref:DUF1189 family protein n=1 Tax=Cerasibacillus sp. TaxID=2498711 RepID=UPI002F408570